MRYHEDVKRSVTVGLAGLLLTVACAAQVHGVPASVTSPRDGADIFSTPRGIPASVSSLGPQGFSRPRMNPDFIPIGPPRRDRLGRVVMPVPVPLFYGAPYYPVVYLSAGDSSSSYVERVVETPAHANEPQKIILEIRDVRSQPSATVAKEQVPVAATQPEPHDEIEVPRTATVFIFQDGSRKELKDFAITETELIDLSEGLIKRSPLAALDRAATQRANAENGVEVHLPVGSSL